MESTCKTKRTRPHTGLSEPSCWLPVRLGCMHPMVYMHALDNVSKLRPRHEPVESLATPIDHVVPCHPARKGKQEDLWDTADAARRWSSAQDARKRPSFTARHRKNGAATRRWQPRCPAPQRSLRHPESGEGGQRKVATAAIWRCKTKGLGPE